MERSLKDTPYERRIQRLMTGEDGDQYGFYINITDNIVREVKNPEKACWEDETGRPGGVTHWLQKQISQNIFERGTIAYFPDGAEAHTTWISFSKRKIHYLLYR